MLTEYAARRGDISMLGSIADTELPRIFETSNAFLDDVRLRSNHAQGNNACFMWNGHTESHEFYCVFPIRNRRGVVAAASGGKIGDNSIEHRKAFRAHFDSTIPRVFDHALGDQRGDAIGVEATAGHGLKLIWLDSFGKTQTHQ